MPTSARHFWRVWPVIWLRLCVAATGWPRSSSIELIGAFAAIMNEFFWSSPPKATKSDPAETAFAMPARESWPTSTSPAMVAATSGSESSRRNSTSRPKSSRRKSIVRNAPVKEAFGKPELPTTTDWPSIRDRISAIIASASIIASSAGAVSVGVSSAGAWVAWVACVAVVAWVVAAGSSSAPQAAPSRAKPSTSAKSLMCLIRTPP